MLRSYTSACDLQKGGITKKHHIVVLGVGNLMITAAADMMGIPYTKLKKFASILNLKLFNCTTFYRLRG